MRVSQNMLYDNFVKYLNQSTTRLQELSLQASTQKKVNRPSDSPVGMARILNYRDSIQANQQYQANINTATGWLGLADNTLMQVQDIMARINELAVQGANAPMTAENRQSIALEVRQQFDQLISLANTTYEGKSIFAGHRTGEPAYRKGMAVTSNNLDVTSFVQSVKGQSDETSKIQFLNNGSNSNKTAIIGEDIPIDYRYSFDGGESWSTRTLAGEGNTLDLGGVQVALRDNYEVVLSDQYTEDNPLVESSSGGGPNTSTTGEFGKKIVVRIDGVAQLDDPSDTEVQYAISKDGGKTFEDGYSSSIESNRATLELGDGKTLTLDGGVVSDEDLFTIRPATKLNLSPTAIYKGDNKNLPAAEVLSNFNFSVTPKSGSFDGDVRVKILNSNPTPMEDSGDEIEFQYSLDDGSTWSDTLTAENSDSPAILNLPGGEIELGVVGGTNDVQGLEFELHGTKVQNLNTDVHSFAQGSFDQNVLVRIDGDNDISLGQSSTDDIPYSYSLDGGQTWETGNSTKNAISGHYASFALPKVGGVMKLAAQGTITTLSTGDQFLIQPRGADISTEISQDVDMAMNNVGPDIFGGHYQNEAGMETAFEEDEQKNLFLGVGKLIAALETNDQEGVQASLGYLDKAMVLVGNMQADIGARENRLQVTQTMLEGLELNDKERKGRIEDVDFAELMSQLTQQQTVYQAILKSSSMIMKMSLVNYV